MKDRSSRTRGRPAPPPPRQAIDSLDALSVDIARMVEHDVAIDMWDRYNRGERNAFHASALHDAWPARVRRHAQPLSMATAISVRRWIATSPSSNGCWKMCRVTTVAVRRWCGPISTSETGKVYTMLAHAAGRFD